MDKKRGNFADIKVISNYSKSNQKGVTLAVLIVIIVILLILAGISLRSIIGDDGIIYDAENAIEGAEVTRYKTELQTLVTRK